VRFPNVPPPDVPIVFLRMEIELVTGKATFDRMIRNMCEPREVPRPVYGAELIGVGLEE